MTLDDYLDQETFPKTTQEGLSAKDQLFLDAARYDMAKELLDAGDKLTVKQKAVWDELKAKKPHMARLARQVAEQGAADNAE